MYEWTILMKKCLHDIMSWDFPIKTKVENLKKKTTTIDYELIEATNDFEYWSKIATQIHFFNSIKSFKKNIVLNSI